MTVNTKYFFKYNVFAFFLGLTLFLSPVAQAGVTAPIKWTFEFNSCEYSRALDEISQKTGLNIEITRFPERVNREKDLYKSTLGIYYL